MRIARAWFVPCLLVVGCAASSEWDHGGAEALEQKTAGILRSLDAGDFMGMLADADSNFVILDFDENNNPIRSDGINAARAFMTRMTEVAKTQGLKFNSNIVRNDAWATATMGFCVVEYDQTIGVGGEIMGPFKFRGTLVARKAGDRWLTTHWHGSFRETPPPMAMPDSAAAPAAR